MRRFIIRHLDKIWGVIEGFDRIVFRGWLGELRHEAGMLDFLMRQGALLKDFEPFAKTATSIIRAEAEAQAARLHGSVHYLPSASTSKETLAKQYLEDRGRRAGPICILSTVEPCMTWQVRRSREHRHPQMLVRKAAKCLHYYHYFNDPIFGFGHVRIQSWLPFQVRVCLNGREWLGRRLDDHRLRYQRADNTFLQVADIDRAQDLMDGFLRVNWPQALDHLVLSANSALHAFIKQLGAGFYWTVWQSEWATDVMFRDQATLASCYPSFVQHALTHLQSRDVLRFLGKRLVTTCRGEVVTDYKHRPEGIRVKHAAKWNSVKMYDKFGQVLRVEATINQPNEFKVRRRAQGKPDSPRKLRPLRRSVFDIRPLAQVGKGCTHRYLDTLGTVDVKTPFGKVLEPLTRPTEIGGRRVRGLRPWAEPDLDVLQAISRGEFLTNGFRNRDIVPLIFPHDASDEVQHRKLSAKVTRLLRLLRAHALVERIAGTHRYIVTARGRDLIAAILATRKASISSLQKCA